MGTVDNEFTTPEMFAMEFGGLLGLAETPEEALLHNRNLILASIEWARELGAPLRQDALAIYRYALPETHKYLGEITAAEFSRQAREISCLIPHKRRPRTSIELLGELTVGSIKYLDMQPKAA